MKELAELSKHFKDTLILPGDDERLAAKYVSTGISTLDAILTGGKGLAAGRAYIIYGEYGVGKTFIVQHIAAAMQKQGGTVMLIDAERCYDSEWWKATGVDISKLIVTKPLTGEMAFDIAEYAVQCLDMVIIDSFAALLPTAEHESTMGQHGIALQARLINKGLRKVTAVNEHCIFIAIQQKREKIVTFGNPDTLPGGKGQEFHASIMLRVSRASWIVEGETKIGMSIKALTVKNKLFPPWLECVIPMRFTGEIDHSYMLFELALAKGIITQKGPYYYIGEEKWLGKVACMAYVQEHLDELTVKIH